MFVDGNESVLGGLDAGGGRLSLAVLLWRPAATRTSSNESVSPPDRCRVTPSVCGDAFFDLRFPMELDAVGLHVLRRRAEISASRKGKSSLRPSMM